MTKEINMVESCSAYEEINDFPFALLDKSKHDRESFDCGVEPLNQYIKQYARQHMQKNISRTIVFYNPDGDKKLKSIVGFVTVKTAKIYVDLSGKGETGVLLTEAVKIGRLAVDVNYQKKGFGQDLLLTVLRWIYEEIKEKQPDKPVVIVVDAKDGAIEFYKKYGFSQVKENDANQLYTILE